MDNDLAALMVVKGKGARDVSEVMECKKKKGGCRPSGNCNLSDDLKMGRQVCFLAAFGRRGELLSKLKSFTKV